MRPNSITNRNILFSPLNWGMGHVSRSISLLKELQGQGNAIFIACNSNQKSVFEEYLAEVTFIEHTGYPFEFKGKGKFGIDLILSYPDLQMRMDKEKKEVADYIERYSIDLIISDHRYGFKSSEVSSIFVTHQTNLPVKWYHFGANKVHQKMINKFDHTWVLDFDDNRLAGKLSNVDGIDNPIFIGPYSRFKMYNEATEASGGTVLIASGPRVYGQQLIDQYRNESDEITVICSPYLEVPENMTRISGSWKQQDEVILAASKVISRSGYTTIMDLYFLKKDYYLIPTPGQEEQIYLAKKMESK